LALISADAREWIPDRATRRIIACLAQGNVAALALKNHLFPNVIAPRNHTSDSHPVAASWAKGTMIGRSMGLGHVPSMDDFSGECVTFIHEHFL
jgi:hypothetical protein